MEVNGLWIRGDESLHSGSGEALHQGIERERERERVRVFFKFLGFNLFFFTRPIAALLKRGHRTYAQKCV